jgi:hypothetical protein
MWILNSFPIPEGIQGTVTFYVVIVKAGRTPPVSVPSELTPSTANVILLDRKSISIY